MQTVLNKNLNTTFNSLITLIYYLPRGSGPRGRPHRPPPDPFSAAAGPPARPPAGSERSAPAGRRPPSPDSPPEGDL